MGRTEEVVRKTLAAVEASLYDIGILTDRGMFPRMEGITASQCMSRLRYLKYRNANGAHIYFRPSGERRFTLLDDLDGNTLATLAGNGFEPCAIIETSPNNYQAWLKHTHVLSKALGTLAAQTLAHRFEADPSAADWRRFGRLPGFTNRKPQHRKADGHFPFVRLHSHSGQHFTRAEAFEKEVFSLFRSREMERLKQRQSFRPRTERAVSLSLSRFRTSQRYQGRPAAADIAFSIAALANGWSQTEVADRIPLARSQSVQASGLRAQNHSQSPCLVDELTPPRHKHAANTRRGRTRFGFSPSLIPPTQHAPAGAYAGAVPSPNLSLVDTPGLIHLGSTFGFHPIIFAVPENFSRLQIALRYYDLIARHLAPDGSFSA